MQLGQQRDIEFEAVEFGATFPSSQASWPTKFSPTQYKFNSIWLELSPEKINIERQTYSMLEWLGDVGGLFDGLRLIFSLLIAPVASLAMKSELLISVFREVPSTKTFVSNRLHQWATEQHVKIQPKRIHLSLHCCRWKSRYRKMMDRAESKMNRQLDLVVFA